MFAGGFHQHVHPDLPVDRAEQGPDDGLYLVDDETHEEQVAFHQSDPLAEHQSATASFSKIITSFRHSLCQTGLFWILGVVFAHVKRRMLAPAGWNNWSAGILVTSTVEKHM